MNNKQNILSRLSDIEQQISGLSEKLYDPQITASEQKEISKKKKKLDKTKRKLYKRLNIV